MSWAAVLVPAGVLAALLVVPGWTLLRCAGVRGLLAVGGAAPVSVALVGVTAFLAGMLGVPWGWAPIGAALFVAVLVAWILGRWVAREERSRGLRPAGLWARRFELGGARWPWVVASLAVAALLLCVPVVLGMGAPDAVLQQWDAVFHLNGVRAVQETGLASNRGAMRPLYGEIGPKVYYPAVWHAMVALLPAGGSVTLAANASTFVLGGLVWPLGIAALVRVLLWRWWTATPLALLLVATFGAFPAVVLSTLAQWPYALAVALVPGATALAVASRARVDRGVPATAPARLVVTVLVVLTAAGGVGLAHGSGIFSLGLLLGPYVLAALTHAASRRWAAGQRGRVVVSAVVGGVALVGGLVVVLTNPTVQNMLSFPRATKAFYPATIGGVLIDQPLSGPVGDLVVAVATIAGIVVVLRARIGAVPWLPVRPGSGAAQVERARADLQGITWVVGAWALVVVLTALAAGPPMPLRVLTGLWYSQPARIQAVLPVVAVPLAALGCLVLGGVIARRLGWRDGTVPAVVRAGGATTSRAAASIVVLALVTSVPWTAPATAGRFAEAYEPGATRWGHMLSPDEVRLLGRLDRVLPPDALVVGDPANGAALVWAVADRRVFLPQLSVSNLTADQRLLRASFSDLVTDPAVCDAVRRNGITHLYVDTATPADGAKVDAGAPGLHRAPTEGVEVVDSEGTATVYRLTVCQP
ncbi:DUF6541 family protein [Sanguibacter massiliensis]|uniref:DUF6541 family protein n=1 Tax=Sanguibacter massiliensis TaxID=1973217 RepID=UPI000C864444|nr:DUF6541 family protein [Sanguibacter massiliensis]